MNLHAVTFSPLAAGRGDPTVIIIFVVIAIVVKLVSWLAENKKKQQGRTDAGIQPARRPIDVPDSFGPPIQARTPLEELLENAREEARRRKSAPTQKTPTGTTARQAPSPQRPPPMPNRTSQPTPQRASAGRGTPGGSQSRFPTESVRTQQPSSIRAPEGISLQQTIHRAVNTQAVTESAPATHVTAAAPTKPGNSAAALIAMALQRPGFLRNQVLLAEVLGRPAASRERMPWD